MRKYGLLLCCFLLLFALLTACGRTQERAGEDAGKSDDASLSAVSSQPQTAERTVTGTVVEASSSSLTLQTDNNVNLLFSIPDEVKPSFDTLLLGDQLTVHYLESKEDLYPIVEVQNLSAELPASYQDGGIFAEYYQQAYQQVRQMSTEEKVGQMFLIRCPQSDVEEVIRTYHPGGLVLFGRDFADRSAEEIIAALQSYQQASSIPLVTAVDEEGGTVVRISSNPLLRSSRFSSPQQLYAQGGLEAIRQDANEKAELLLSLGLNVNLAPVADVSVDVNDYIYDRTLGRPASNTADFVSTVVEASQAGGLSCTLKHFPGYGNNADTHTGISVDERPFESFVETDFLPFQAGIDAGVHCVLVSHNVVNCMDDSLPASLSNEVHQILRETLGFTGIVLTDDLSMDAISRYSTEVPPAVQAVLCGNDMLTSTNYAEEYQQVLAAVKDSIISEETVTRAAIRIVAWKMAKGLL